MTFSEKLIRLRKREGISQEELASYWEVSRQAVSRWEQGTALPDAGNLLKLRQRFGVSVDWLLTEEQGWEAQEGKPAAQTACESARTASQPEKRKNILPWAVPLGISAFGLLLLGIFASLFPAVYISGAVATPSGGSAPERVVTGLYGFLLCNRLEWLFWLCVIVAIGSLAAGIWQAAAWNRIETEREPADGEKKE